MNYLLFYNNKDSAISTWLPDTNAAHYIAQAMKKEGWNVVWTLHTTDKIWPMNGYEEAYEEWKKLVG